MTTWITPRLVHTVVISDQRCSKTSISRKLCSHVGGKIGWIKTTSVSKSILDELDKLDIGEITKPIKVRNLFLILKIEDKKESKIKIDFDIELEKLVNLEKNKQFHQFSLIYLNKIKQNTFISDQ